MTAVAFPSLAWVERLRAAANADPEFQRAAEWFDGWILLHVGAKEYSLKIFMGQVIKVVEGRVPFGATFAIRGADTAWRTLFGARKNILRELLFRGQLTLDGNVFESARITKAVNLLVDAGRRLGAGGRDD